MLSSASKHFQTSVPWPIPQTASNSKGLKILRREVGLEEPELASLPATALAFTLWQPIIPSTTEPGERKANAVPGVGEMKVLKSDEMAGIHQKLFGDLRRLKPGFVGTLFLSLSLSQPMR